MKYVVIFSGINVGGKHIVKMQELKALFLEMGFTGVQTYIQSGNVVVESNREDAAMQAAIGDAFDKKFGFFSNIIIRSQAELQELIAQLPFTQKQITDAQTALPQAEHLYVYFLASKPLKEEIDTVFKDKNEDGDLCYLGEREIYLLCKQSIRISKMAIRLNKTFKDATIRNWKTVLKLYDLCQENQME